MVGDFPSSQDIVGIACIVAGAYVLQIQSVHQGLLAPVLAIFREPGPRRMLCVAFIYSLTSNFDKIGVQNSSPLLEPLHYQRDDFRISVVASIPATTAYCRSTHEHPRNSFPHRPVSSSRPPRSQYRA